MSRLTHQRVTQTVPLCGTVLKLKKKEKGIKLCLQQVKYSLTDPDALNENSAFSNVIVVTGSVKTVYVGGQDAVDASGTMIGEREI